MDMKTRPGLYCLQGPTSDLGIHTDCRRQNGNILHVNENQKKFGVAILISDRIDFKIKTVT